MKRNSFRRTSPVFAILMCLCMMVATAAPAFATESNEAVHAIMENMSQKRILSEEEIANLAADENGMYSVLDASAFYDTLRALDNEAFGQLKYDIPTSVQSTAILNGRYESMRQGLEDLGFGESFQLEVKEMTSGYAQDITAEFESIYGDLSYKYDSSASLPEGWDMESLMTSAQIKRDQYASDIKNSDAYKTVSSHISANKTVSQAITTLETPELKSALSLQEMIDATASDIGQKWTTSSNEGHAALQAIYDSSTQDKYNEDFQALFDEAKGDTQAWLILSQDLEADPRGTVKPVYDAINGFNAKNDANDPLKNEQVKDMQDTLGPVYDTYDPANGSGIDKDVSVALKNAGR